MKQTIKVEYDGDFPNLCAGKLSVTINGKKWEFPDYCLRSGGSVSFTESWDEIITTGNWSIREWPENFPENLKKTVLNEINCTLPHGCCGGCV